MPISFASNVDVDSVTELMRDLSRKTDPDEAAELYARGLRKLNIVPNDRYLSLSRRALESPRFVITRCSTWKEHPNPWTEKHKLPHLSGGLLAELLYSNRAAIVRDLPAQLSPDDPAYEYLHDMKLLVALPHYDDGESINVGVLLSKHPETFPIDNVPMMIWQANLWGRATLNLVNRQKLDEAYKSLDRELRVVGEIQKSLLPRALPEIPGVDIAVHYQTSQRAGGDYYDFFPLPEGMWGIFVADVSGHGTPAAVMMAITHAIAHSHPGHPMPPPQVLRYLNEQLSRLYTQGSGTFITAFYGVLDPSKMTLRYSSAGHPPPRLIRGGAPVELGASQAFPLGISPGEEYPDHVAQLQAGDKLVLYTDGILESFDPLGELFGVGRLDRAAAHADATARGLVDRILTDVERFTANGALTDDRTLLALLFE